jgi:erythromycin esterase-like protein
MRWFTDGGSSLDAMRQAAQPLTGAASDYDTLLEAVGDARFVLIGEASHGTHEFYQVRAEMTRRLIEERRFNAIIAEADWPDAFRVNLYVRGAGNDASPEEALGSFRRFPAWMWRNTVVVDFVSWLREHNATLSDQRQMAGFYGMDLYSLNASIEAVIGYLNSVDPEAARRAIERYSCFEMFSRDPETYGYATGFGAAEPCEEAVVEQLREMQQRATGGGCRLRRRAERAPGAQRRGVPPLDVPWPRVVMESARRPYG